MAERTDQNDHVSPTNVQKALKGMDYPASKQDLVQRARDNGASGEIIEKIQQLPGDQYDSPAGVMKAFGKTE